MRYVGKTIQPVANRLRAHILHAARPYGKKTHCRNWIRSLDSLGLMPIATTLVRVDDGGDWVWWERFWIRWFREIEPKLTNHCDGGEGAPGRESGEWSMCYWCGAGVYRRPHQVGISKCYCSKYCCHAHRPYNKTNRGGGAKRKNGWSVSCRWCGKGIYLSKSKHARTPSPCCSSKCMSSLRRARSWRNGECIVGRRQAECEQR